MNRPPIFPGLRFYLLEPKKWGIISKQSDWCTVVEIYPDGKKFRFCIDNWPYTGKTYFIFREEWYNTNDHDYHSQNMLLAGEKDCPEDPKGKHSWNNGDSFWHAKTGQIYQIQSFISGSLNTKAIWPESSKALCWGADENLLKNVVYVPSAEEQGIISLDQPLAHIEEEIDRQIIKSKKRKRLLEILQEIN